VNGQIEYLLKQAVMKRKGGHAEGRAGEKGETKVGGDG